MNCYPKMEEIDSPEIRVFWLSQACPNMVKKPRVIPRKSDKFIGAENSLGKIRHLDYVRTVSNIFFVFVLSASQMTMSHLIPTFRNICRSNRWMLFVFYKQKIDIHETRENRGFQFEWVWLDLLRHAQIFAKCFLEYQDWLTNLGYMKEANDEMLDDFKLIWRILNTLYFFWLSVNHVARSFCLWWF